MMINNKILQTSLVLLKKDLKGRYADSIIGPAWIIIHPLLLSMVTVFVFSFFFKNTTKEIPYYIFVLNGFIHWIFFSTSIQKIAISIRSHKNVIQNMNVNIFVFPTSALFSKMVDFGIGLSILLILSVISHSIKISPFLLLYPPLLFIQIIFQFGIGLIAVTLSSIYKDTVYVIDISLQILFYLTPVVYDLNILPKPIQKILIVNPLALFFTQYRNMLFYGKASIPVILYLLLLSMIILTYGIHLIKKYRYVFPEVI